MRLERIEIKRFRGIKELSWDLGGSLVCLLGPGDSTKTTILDAIEFALSPRWNIQFDDADFYEAKTDKPIKITVTVGDLPDELKSEARYGLLARGWSQTGELHDEPEEGDQLVLSIRLMVDSSLEPMWTVLNDRVPEGKPMRVKDRERLGCTRLGDYLDRHFSWGRGSILSRLTSESESLSGILAAVGRAARTQLADSSPRTMTDLHLAAEVARAAGAEFGVAPKHSYRPHLDVQSVLVGTGGLALHDGEIPVRRAGLNTRRLLAMAMQWEFGKSGGVVLVDEVEHGLEPHRIRRFLTALRNVAEVGSYGQVLMTTHAPIVLPMETVIVPTTTPNSSPAPNVRMEPGTNNTHATT